MATIRALFGKYDVIHFHAEGPCLMIPIAKFFGKRCVATIHGLDWQRAKWGNFATKMLLKGEKAAALHADEVIVLSKNVQDYFKEKYSRDTHFIPNGISKPQKVEPYEITSKYGLKGDDYILTLSRIVPEKGIHYLLHAYKKIDTDKKLVIAGGASNAADYMEEIKKLAEAYKVDVEQIKKSLPVDEIAKDVAVGKALDFVKANAVITEIDEKTAEEKAKAKTEKAEKT